MTEILSATIYDLEPSPQNPRKRFDPAELEELGRSIAEKGIIEPLVVRRHPKKKGKWEIVCGERRWRAAKIAGTETVSCIVRELDDVEVLEIQTIENIQRDDLHPLEEADGYARLMKRPGYDVGRIARKVGRSEKYVYDRVKLLQLTPQAKKLFLEDRFTAGHAILLARLIPDDQSRALDPDRATGVWRQERGFRWAEDGEDDDDFAGLKPVSVREFQGWIDENVRFRPEEVDLPNLFPDTAKELAAAQEEELKIVKITREYRVPDQARDPEERTYGNASWKRADGQPDHQVQHDGRRADPCPEYTPLNLPRSHSSSSRIICRRCPN